MCDSSSVFCMSATSWLCSAFSAVWHSPCSAEETLYAREGQSKLPFESCSFDGFPVRVREVVSGGRCGGWRLRACSMSPAKTTRLFSLCLSAGAFREAGVTHQLFSCGRQNSNVWAERRKNPCVQISSHLLHRISQVAWLSWQDEGLARWWSWRCDCKYKTERGTFVEKKQKFRIDDCAVRSLELKAKTWQAFHLLQTKKSLLKVCKTCDILTMFGKRKREGEKEINMSSLERKNWAVTEIIKSRDWENRSRVVSSIWPVVSLPGRMSYWFSSKQEHLAL